MRRFSYSACFLLFTLAAAPSGAQVIEGSIDSVLQQELVLEAAVLGVGVVETALEPALTVTGLSGETVQGPAGNSLPGLGEAERSGQETASPDNTGTSNSAQSAGTELLPKNFSFNSANVESYTLRCAGDDQDGDGVCDVDDRCPDTPEGVAVLSSGCHLGSGDTLVLYGVHFAFDSAQLTRASAPELFHALQSLRQNPGLQVEIAGHTDDRGSDEYNLRLSNARAKAVYDVMVHNGIEPERLSFSGYGRSQPIAANTRADGSLDLQGMAENRRVEFRILSDHSSAMR